MYGWRGRIGLLIPSSNTTMEHEFSTHVPKGVSVHTTRVPLQEAIEEELIKMSEELEKSAELLVHLEPDVIVYGCTSGTLIKGKGYNGELEERINRIVDVPTITTAGAVVDALTAKKITKVAVATPYIDEVNEKEKKFLVENGFEVCAIRGLNIRKNIDIGKQEPYVAYKLGKKLIEDCPKVDGLFISCTNFRTFEIISLLSNHIKKPVITSNQATLWRALREIGLCTELMSDR